MEQERFGSFSLEKLFAMNDLSQVGAVYNRECFIISCDPGKEIELFKYPCKINAFILVICSEGEISLTCNLNSCEIKKNTLFFCHSGAIIQLKSYTACQLQVIILEEEFLKNLNIDVKRILPYYPYMQEMVLIDLPQDESTFIKDLLDKAALEIVHSFAKPYYHDMVKALIHSLAYKILNIFIDFFLAQLSANRMSLNHGEEYFKMFISLLMQHYKSERSVGFYASKLNLTPKYLTTLIKKVSGRSAADWIDEYVVLEAKALLKYSDMSVQQIAYYLNFSDQSFFGKYFKKQAGVSPTVYKMQK